MKRQAPRTAIAGVALLVAGCVAPSGSDSSEPSFESGAKDAVNKYEQTWPKDYSSTTCLEWKRQMTPKQKFAGAADTLTGARNKGDGGSGLPPDSLIEEFQQGITTACVIPREDVASVAVGVYLTERSTFRP